MVLVHGTTVEIAGAGVLIRGPSGSGKSDLALRLIDGGAKLVADDQTEISAKGDGLWAKVPAAIAGLLEVRGLGVIRLAHRGKTRLRLVVDLVAESDIERMPEPRTARLLDRELPLLVLAAFHASTPAKVRLAVLSAKRDIMNA